MALPDLVPDFFCSTSTRVPAMAAASAALCVLRRWLNALAPSSPNPAIATMTSSASAIRTIDWPSARWSSCRWLKVPSFVLVDLAITGEIDLWDDGRVAQGDGCA